MHILVLGSAAGGGFPQWNCNAPTSRGVREGSIEAKPRTQASIAVSVDGTRWLLINASPDLRQQILANAELWPREGLRHSPIEAVLLTNAEIDHVAGLMSLREGQPFSLWATARVHGVLDENPIFGALNPAVVARKTFPLGRAFAPDGPHGDLGVTIEAFPVPGKVPLFLENRAGDNLAGEAEDTIGLKIGAGGRHFFYIPGCARLEPALAERLRGADLLFFDGTLWSDDELVALGISHKTGARMGHMSLSGPAGTFAAFADLDIARKLFIHVNTTNPVLDEGSPQHAQMLRHGWQLAEDGMRIQL